MQQFVYVWPWNSQVIFYFSFFSYCTLSKSCQRRAGFSSWAKSYFFSTPSRCHYPRIENHNFKISSPATKCPSQQSPLKQDFEKNTKLNIPSQLLETVCDSSNCPSCEHLLLCNECSMQWCTHGFIGSKFYRTQEKQSHDTGMTECTLSRLHPLEPFAHRRKRFGRRWRVAEQWALWTGGDDGECGKPVVHHLRAHWTRGAHWWRACVCNVTKANALHK